MIKVLCLDTGKELAFFAKTGIEAMQKALYTLNVTRLDNSAKIELFGGGRTLAFTHNGKTYSTLANGSYIY